MREEELRSRLQALAVAGRAALEPAAIGAVHRRARRKLQVGTALALVGLLVAVGGVRLASELGDRRGARLGTTVGPGHRRGRRPGPADHVPPSRRSQLGLGL